jgi:hypothetical protein
MADPSPLDPQSIEAVNEAMRNRIAQGLMNPPASPGISSSGQFYTPEGGWMDPPFGAGGAPAPTFTDRFSAAQGGTFDPGSFSDPSYFPSNSGVPNPASQAIDQQIGPQTSMPPSYGATPSPPSPWEGGGSPGQFYTPEGGWMTSPFGGGYPATSYNPSTYSPPTFPYQEGGSSSVAQNPTQPLTPAQQAYAQAHLERYGEPPPANYFNPGGGWDQDYGPGGRLPGALPAPGPSFADRYNTSSMPPMFDQQQAISDLQQTLGTIDAATGQSGYTPAEQSYRQAHYDRYGYYPNASDLAAAFAPGAPGEGGASTAMQDAQNALRLGYGSNLQNQMATSTDTGSPVGPPSLYQGAPDTTNYTPAEQSYRQAHLDRYGYYPTAADLAAAFVPGAPGEGGPAPAPAPAPAPPPSQDTLTPADRAASQYSQAQQDYRQAHLSRYGRYPTDAELATAFAPGTAGEGGPAPASSGPTAWGEAVPGGIKGPYLTQGYLPAQATWLQGQIGWGSDAGGWYSLMQPGFVPAGGFRYVTQPQAQGQYVPPPGGGSWPGSTYQGGQGQGDYSSPGYQPGGGLSDPGYSGSTFTGGGGPAWDANPPGYNPVQIYPIPE